jgi:hypothetical protein
VHHLFIHVVYLQNKTNNMKKTLLLACTIVSFATISHAQIKKGSVLLGGGISVGKSTTETNSEEGKSNSISFSPAVGLAIKDNWVVGLFAGISNYENRPSTVTSKQTIESFGGGLFVRRYNSLGKGFYLYGHGAISYSNFSQRQMPSTDFQMNYSSKGVGIYISPGVAYAVSNRFHLEASLNNLVSLSYSKTRTDNISLSGYSTAESKGFNLETNLNTTAPLSLGFRFVLGK